MSELIDRTVLEIRLPDESERAELRRRLDEKTKPRGSLGRLEELAVRVAAAGGRGDALDPVVVVVAADHGVARRGVSAYPQEVTRQMLAAFTGGDAAVCVLARQAGADLIVVDAGVVEPLGDPLIVDLRQGDGTADFTEGPAMTRARAETAIETGIGLGGELARTHGLIALGEMGIGNSTSAAAVTSALLGVRPEDTCGRGTGLDDEGLARKITVVQSALELHRPDPADPIGVVAAVGGFELAMLAGLALGAAAEDIPVVVDGYISSAAALVAARLAPALPAHMVASHRSSEPGHALVLEALGLEPVLDLGLRLGEGSGAALALPLIRSALAILDEMATFADAGVTDAGR
jgi:nicotinate-nucleotide--dimethylbenzimidazole phosphoribosyltransferase